MQETATVVEIAWRVIQSAGIIIGGVWVYMLFIRQRKFKDKLRLSVEGRIIGSGLPDRLRILSVSSVENVGEGVAVLRDIGNATSLQALVFEAPTQNASEGSWNEIGTYRSLGDSAGAAIESGGLIQDRQVFELPPVGTGVVKLTLTVNTVETSWIATDVVYPAGNHDNIAG